MLFLDLVKIISCKLILSTIVLLVLKYVSFFNFFVGITVTSTSFVPSPSESESSPSKLNYNHL